MNNRKFNDLTIEEDTKLISRVITKVKDISCVHEFWNWDGVSGESIIFYTEDVKSLADSDILELVFNKELKNIKDYTLKRQDKFVYVNFNFKSS